MLTQSYKNYEHIIVDGNSSDKTIKIIKSYKKKLSILKIEMIRVFIMR